VSCAPGTESRLRAIYRESFIAGVAGLGPHGLALVLLGFGLASAVRSAAARRTVGARAVPRSLRGACLAGLSFLFAQRSTHAGAGDTGPAAGDPALGVGQLGADNGAASAAGGVGSGTGTGQPLHELLSNLPRQRNGCRSGRSGHC
jgi:hypothetical protein